MSMLGLIVISSIFSCAEDKNTANVQNEPWKSDPKFDLVVDKITARETQFIKSLREYSPMVETYIQNMRSDNDLGSVPASDQYFLGRVNLQAEVEDVNFLPQQKEPQANSLQKIFSKLTRTKRSGGKPVSRIHVRWFRPDDHHGHHHVRPAALRFPLRAAGVSGRRANARN